MHARIKSKDWDRVHAVACEVANAAMMDDVLLESNRVAMLELLDELANKHGDIPAILATRADYLDDRDEATACLRRALEIARQDGDKEEEAEILDSIRNFDAI